MRFLAKIIIPRCTSESIHTAGPTVNRLAKKLFLVCCATLLCISQGQTQILKTKDGIEVGSRQDFITTCVNGVNMKTLHIHGVEIDTYTYCSCISDKLIPTLNSEEIIEAAEKNEMEELFLKKENLGIIRECYEGTFTIEDDFKFKDIDSGGMNQKVATKYCVDAIMNGPIDGTEWTLEIAEEYCNCAISKMYVEGYTYKDILEIESEDSEAFNEIAVPCINDIMKSQALLEPSNSYMPADIIGSDLSSKVSLLDYLGQGYKVKIQIDGVTKYYLFDTGASDLLINNDLERELLLNGSLKKEDYIGTKVYTLADNKTVEAKLVRLSNVVIGDYTVNNVTAALLVEGSLLCGKGFLDKFRKWELDKDKKLLILYR